MSTGQIDDLGLSARMQAAELKKKDNLTLAEQLIVASNEDKFTFTYKGIPIEIWTPTQNDFAKFVELYNSVLIEGDTSKRTQEENEALDAELYSAVADLCIDDSITQELLKSGMLGTSFIPKLMNEIQEHQKREVNEVTAVKRFRRK